MPNSLNINRGLENIKSMIENSIRINGEAGKKAVINSSQTINVLHEVVKADLIQKRVNANLVKPALGSSSLEIQLAGFLKFKTQDICVFPNHIQPTQESINFNGLHTGKIDPYGELFSEHILTINLRSQLSSLAKNKDTMYERTYAEPLNLHRRLPKMVLGEVYLLSARELDSNQVKIKNVVYKQVSTRTAKSLEEYVYGFAALNSRSNQGDDFFKYERVALLIVDFSQTPLKVYENAHDLKADGLLPPHSNCSLSGMTYTGFIDDLLAIYNRRFGTGKLS
jgi:hypothetical protein